MQKSLAFVHSPKILAIIYNELYSLRKKFFLANTFYLSDIPIIGFDAEEDLPQ